MTGSLTHTDSLGNEEVLERGDTHLLKYPPLVNCYRALGFMASTMVIAQLCAGHKRRLQPSASPPCLLELVHLLDQYRDRTLIGILEVLQRSDWDPIGVL